MKQITIAMILAVSVLTGIADTKPANEKPNVVIVLTDDQGYADLSCHGNPYLKTPELDKLHSQSIRLTDFHSAPVCTPSRGQLLTGRDAMDNGAWSWAYGHEMIGRDIPTLAHIFKENGYRTGHFGKWHLGDNYPYRPQDKGFQESITFGGAAPHQTPDYWQNDTHSDFYQHTDGVWRQHKGFSTDVWFDLSMDFMKRCQAKRTPFICYLPTNAPHDPYLAPEKYLKRFRSDPNLPVEFFGMIENLDENMGRLDAFLEKSGLAENTIVIFMTDNGSPSKQGARVYNAGMRGAKARYYEGGHRVPCFIRWPEGNLGKPRDIDELTQMQDLLPTLIDLCGLNVEKQTREQFDGTSLAGLIKGTSLKLEDRMLVSQWSRLDYPEYGSAAVMWKKWRLVNDKELYHVANDLGQEEDLADQHPEIVEKMKQHYADWWKDVEPKLDGYARIIIGGGENPSRLTCFEWRKKTTDANATDGATVWKGLKLNGEWMLEVAEAGTYRVDLHRYPKETDTAMTASYPAIQRELKFFPACKALPITTARLRIGKIDQTIPVQKTDKSASFEIELPAGETSMKTWLMDDQGTELCGAYYVNVERLNP